MKAFVYVILFLFMLVQPAQANSTLSKKLSYQKHKEYTTEASQAYQACNRDRNYALAYDCKCIAAKFYETRVNSDDFFTHEQILKESLEGCKNAPKLANHYYTQCTSWAGPTRKDAHEFCECYGNSMGRNFEKQTFQNARMTEGIMAMAMNECNLRKPFEEQKQREKAKENLKKKGWFERLFPSFNDNE